MGLFYSTLVNVTVSNANDFLQFRPESNRFMVIHEVRVFQDLGANAVGNTIRIRRGTEGSGGSPTTIYRHDVNDPGSVSNANGAPTVNVASFDFDYEDDWFPLREFLWLPTPETLLIVSSPQKLGISLGTVADINLVCNVQWEEIGK